MLALWHCSALVIEMTILALLHSVLLSICSCVQQQCNNFISFALCVGALGQTHASCASCSFADFEEVQLSHDATAAPQDVQQKPAPKKGRKGKKGSKQKATEEEVSAASRPGLAIDPAQGDNFLDNQWPGLLHAAVHSE